MAEHCFGQLDNIFLQKTNFYSSLCKRNGNYNKKTRLAKCRTLYYANTVVILCLILSGDIPGNKHQSLLHLQHATKQSVVTVKNLLHRLS